MTEQARLGHSVPENAHSISTMEIDKGRRDNFLKEQSVMTVIPGQQTSTMDLAARDDYNESSEARYNSHRIPTRELKSRKLKGQKGPSVTAFGKFGIEDGRLATVSQTGTTTMPETVDTTAGRDPPSFAHPPYFSTMESSAYESAGASKHYKTRDQGFFSLKSKLLGETASVLGGQTTAEGAQRKPAMTPNMHIQQDLPYSKLRES